MNAYNEIRELFMIRPTAISLQFDASQKSLVCLLRLVLCTRHLFFSSPNSAVYCAFQQNIYQMLLDDRL